MDPRFCLFSGFTRRRQKDKCCLSQILVVTLTCQLAGYVSIMLEWDFFRFLNIHPTRGMRRLGKGLTDYCLRQQCHVSERVWIIKIAKKMNGGQTSRSLPLNHSPWWSKSFQEKILTKGGFLKHTCDFLFFTRKVSSPRHNNNMLHTDEDSRIFIHSYV